LDDFNRRLAADLAGKLDSWNGDGKALVKAALDAFVAEESISYDFMASDIASACMERAEEAEGRAEEAEKETEALRKNPEVYSPEFSPEALRWDEREGAFICPLTRNRFRLVRD
jgi:hypothetical protein